MLSDPITADENIPEALVFACTSGDDRADRGLRDVVRDCDGDLLLVNGMCKCAGHRNAFIFAFSSIRQLILRIRQRVRR